jgi:hypothetical protein
MVRATLQLFRGCEAALALSAGIAAEAASTPAAATERRSTGREGES